VGDREHPRLEKVGRGQVGRDRHQPDSADHQPEDGAREVSARQAEGGSGGGGTGLRERFLQGKAVPPYSEIGFMGNNRKIRVGIAGSLVPLGAKSLTVAPGDPTLFERGDFPT
jgi:hypothetical protein